MTVELVRESNLDELLPLVRDYCDFYEVNPADERLRYLSQILIKKPAEGSQLLARDGNGEAIGFATVLWSWDTLLGARIGIMHDLFVRPESRGGGVAGSLIEACRRLARDRGAARLTWSTAPDNERAQRVYERVGATREQWVDYWLDAAR